MVDSVLSEQFLGVCVLVTLGNEEERQSSSEPGAFIGKA